jgi:hypothetical protein
VGGTKRPGEQEGRKGNSERRGDDLVDADTRRGGS